MPLQSNQTSSLYKEHLSKDSCLLEKNKANRPLARSTVKMG
jgi:hypothetical protein